MSIVGQQQIARPTEMVPSRLADRVVEHLVDSIINGDLVAGDKMPAESQIADSFGVSKQIAREAVRQLAAIGLVHVQQGKPSRVKSFNAEPLGRFYGLAIRGSQKRLLEATELRRVIETGIACIAAERRKPEGLIALEAATRSMERSLDDTSQLTEADVAFHQAIPLVTGNQMLALQISGLRPIMEEVSQFFTDRSGRTREEWVATFERHAEIFEAIRAGDVERTNRAMITHFAAADLAAAELFRSESK